MFIIELCCNLVLLMTRTDIQFYYNSESIDSLFAFIQLSIFKSSEFFSNFYDKQ